jgi:hypothetical protein
MTRMSLAASRISTEMTWVLVDAQDAFDLRQKPEVVRRSPTSVRSFRTSQANPRACNSQPIAAVCGKKHPSPQIRNGVPVRSASEALRAEIAREPACVRSRTALPTSARPQPTTNIASKSTTNNSTNHNPRRQAAGNPARDLADEGTGQRVIERS